MRRHLLGLVVAALVGTVALAAGPAQAAPPTSVVIQEHFVLADGYGTFTLSSRAGLCTSGTITDQLHVTVAGSQTFFHVKKTFTCDDQSGTFTMNLQGVAAPVFRWTIVSGTGAYTNLHGSGSGAGTGTVPGIVEDTYTGSVHFN